MVDVNTGEILASVTGSGNPRGPVRTFSVRVVGTPMAAAVNSTRVAQILVRQYFGEAVKGAVTEVSSQLEQS
jgi:curli biogenesis system outer membrane secretion channel CsgG